MMGKILTAQLREEIYFSLTSHRNRKDVAKDPRGQENYSTMISTSSTTARRDGKKLSMAWINYKMAYDMITQSWIINCLKMYKISHEVINFFKRTMKTWRVELAKGGKSSAEAKIQRHIFQDALSPLIFINTMRQLNHILRKCTAGYKLSKSQEEIIHLMYMDDITQFTKNAKKLETLIHTIRIYS